MLHLFRLVFISGSFLPLTACVWQGNLQSPASDAFALSYAESIDDAESCASAINTSDYQATEISALPGDEIRLLNWNVQKNVGTNIQQDMNALVSGADLVLLQEATLGSRRVSDSGSPYHWAFAPGYKTSQELTGVMTASKAAPITHCSFKNIEPWLGSPKATNITRYALTGRDDTLLVVNLHLINFTVGVADMQQQLNEALTMVKQHQGPVVVSGDFNTWSEARNNSVSRALKNAGLNAVTYQTDLRKRFFGYPVDHVYIRGMRAEQGTSMEVYSSDHNPLSVVLKLEDIATAGMFSDDDNG